MNGSPNWAQRFGAVIPGGSGTLSKKPRWLPDEPPVIVRGRGGRVWDADGREFIDFRNALGPVTLGYAFPAVDQAILEQLKNGIVFGHPHPLECELAEMLCRVIPCAERVRFLKTGGEAIAACLKVARGVSGREHVIQSGYNGWLNGLSARGAVLPGREETGVPTGVPACLSALHHACGWNDVPAVEALLDQFHGQVAAIVVAANYVDMKAGKTFYPALRALADRHGALLIFDEIVTGFRVALGGVQEYFKVCPDLAVFAKGMANGMPLSAFVGRAEIMQGLEQAVVSSTYSGETLSLAAARATIQTYEQEGVIARLWEAGEKIWKGLDGLFVEKGLPVRMRGFWPCAAFEFQPDAPSGFKERFFRAAYRHGVSLYGVSYVNFSHSDRDLDEALERMQAALGDL